MEITPQQLDELRKGALTAIDGLWFMAVEEKFGFDAALELDLEVWKRYGRVLLKRLTRMLGITIDPKDPPDLATINHLMEILCRIDGTQCEGEVVGDEAIFRVTRCSWWDNLSNAGREQHIPCEFIDNTVFLHWLQGIDEAAVFEITHSLPRGDGHCQWVIRRS